ncbi:MAG: hypothetical protein HJJLKODD_02934 [Phycisphaerae bacterium]|nr:hypothetical protein [Phycisphaerae bacterium]
MKKYRTTAVCIFGYYLVVFSGCIGDALMSVRQPVEIMIRDSISNIGITDAGIIYADDTHHYENSDHAKKSNDEWIDYVKQNKIRYETSDSGYARLDVEVVWIAGGGWFADTDMKKDRLTGKIYLFRISKDNVKEILTVPMYQGNIINGKYYSLTIQSIGNPIPLNEYTNKNRENN